MVIATHSDQALALLADPSRARARAAGSDPLPAQRGGAPHRPLAAPAPPARVGELELPPRRTTRPGRSHRDLPHEPPAVAASRPRVLRHAQPHRRDRPGSRSSARSTTRIPSSRRAGVAAQARHARDQRRQNRTHYCGAYWGWGFHEDGVQSALRVVARDRRSATPPQLAGGMSIAEPAARLRGHDPPPPLRGAPARVQPPRWRSPTSTSTSSERRCSAGGSRCAGPGLVRFRRADYLGDPVVPLADAVRALVAEPHRLRRRTARSASSPSCAASATASTRSASTTASTATSASTRSSPR